MTDEQRIDLARMSAIEFDEYRKQATTDELRAALAEVDRLKNICMDVIDLINTNSNSPVVYGDLTVEQCEELFRQIDEVAHGYFIHD